MSKKKSDRPAPSTRYDVEAMTELVTDGELYPTSEMHNARGAGRIQDPPAANVDAKKSKKKKS